MAEIKTTLINPNATVEDTVKQIKVLAKAHANSAAIDRLLEYVPYYRFKNDLQFLQVMYEEIAKLTTYILDQEGREQLKTPDRFLLIDGKGDCDDYAILWAALLTRLNKKYFIKIVKYNPAGDWAHVYITVPTIQGPTIILDNVLKIFNKEVKYYEAKTF